jgi:UDP-galactopyranose mutase
MMKFLNYGKNFYLMNQYDYLIVGSGFFGSICARELTDAGFKCLVLEKRNHIGGNCYTENKDGINIHTYGPHIFHTSNEEVWEWINKYVKFNDFTLRPVANYKGQIYSLPFNMFTFSKMWPISTPEEAKSIIEKQSIDIKDEPKNLEEQAIKLVGYDVYSKLIKGYTEKQWKKPCNELPANIIKRLPVRYTYDNNYFDDKYQGIPIGGYTEIFKKLLDGVEVRLNVDYLIDKNYWNGLAKKIIYTGPIDRYYDYMFGELEYKTTSFEHFKIDKSNYQGTAVMNFTDIEIPYTRIIEHKHFEKIETKETWITYEYPVEYKAEKTEPYYPVNDDVNNAIYNKYKNFTRSEKNVIFGGRLGEYKYYDMDDIIESALKLVKTELK